MKLIIQNLQFADNHTFASMSRVPGWELSNLASVSSSVSSVSSVTFFPAVSSLELSPSPRAVIRAQKSGEDGEESSRTEPNLMDSLVPKQRIKQMDRQKKTEK